MMAGRVTRAEKKRARLLAEYAAAKEASKAAIGYMPAWSRQTVYICGGVLFFATFAMSAWALTLLMELFGIDRPVSFALFLAADAGAAIGLLMWITGDGGELVVFGRRLARGLLKLSIAGNALERAFTFAPIPPGNPAAAGAVARATALVKILSDGPLPVLVATWISLIISILIGIVFPIGAYVMAHAVILARGAEDTPTKSRRTSTAAQPAGAHAAQPKPGLFARVRKATTAVDDDAAGFPAATAALEDRPAAPAARVEPDTAPTQTIPKVEAAEPLPYVHDSRDLEPDTAEWQDRYDRLPGNGKQAKVEYWLEREWELGREPNLAGIADRVVKGSRTAQNAATALKKRGILPPSKRRGAPTPAAEQASANAGEQVRDEVREDAPASQGDVRESAKLARVI